MIDWAIVIGIVAFAIVVLVRHERRSRRRMLADFQRNWWVRRVEERDYYVKKGIELSLSGFADMAPQNFDSKWEHARAVHRFLLGGAGIPYDVDIGAKRSRPTTSYDGVIHYVALLSGGVHVLPVLMCNLDYWADPEAVVDEGQYTTCLKCALLNEERYER